jgi:hypothetical protein
MISTNLDDAIEERIADIGAAFPVNGGDYAAAGAREMAAFLRSPEGLRLLCEAEIGRLETAGRQFWGRSVFADPSVEEEAMTRQYNAWRTILEGLK